MVRQFLSNRAIASCHQSVLSTNPSNPRRFILTGLTLFLSRSWAEVGQTKHSNSEGEQFEVGVKQDLIQDRLSATLTFYQITKQNVLTPDPVAPTFSIVTGEQKSRGVELDLAGEILPGWNIIAFYAYTDAFVNKDIVIPVGDQLVGAPYNSASLWTTYELQEGNLQGLGFGLGLVYVGDRQVSLPNTFTSPSYLRTDALKG